MRMNGHSVGDISSLVSLGPLPSLPWVPSIPFSGPLQSIPGPLPSCLCTVLGGSSSQSLEQAWATLPGWASVTWTGMSTWLSEYLAREWLQGWSRVLSKTKACLPLVYETDSSSSGRISHPEGGCCRFCLVMQLVGWKSEREPETWYLCSAWNPLYLKPQASNLPII